MTISAGTRHSEQKIIALFGSVCHWVKSLSWGAARTPLTDRRLFGSYPETGFEEPKDLPLCLAKILSGHRINSLRQYPDP
jgi:hypothetical protein